MSRLTFKTQMYLSLGFFVICMILAYFTKLGIFHNIGWIVYGLFFIIHPVWPKSWDCHEHRKLKLGCRIAGALAILVGLITRFGV